MSFLDEVNNSIATNNEKHKITAELNSFIEETKKLWIEATYASLKDTILERAKKLSCSYFDGIFSLFSIEKTLPYGLYQKINEYGLSSLFDERFYTSNRDFVFSFGKLKKTHFEVDVDRSYYRKKLFFKKKITYIVQESRTELSLDSTFKEALQELIHMAEKDGIIIDTSCLFLGKWFPNIIKDDNAITLVLDDIHGSTFIENTSLPHETNARFLCNSDFDKFLTIDNMKSFYEGIRNTDFITYCNNRPKMYDKRFKSTSIVLQLKYSIRG